MAVLEASRRGLGPRASKQSLGREVTTALVAYLFEPKTPVLAESIAPHGICVQTLHIPYEDTTSGLQRMLRLGASPVH